VRIDRDVPLLSTARVCAAFAVRSRLAVLCAVKLADASLARMRDDDLDTARLTAEALLAARLSPRVTWVFDTLMDVDRGYFPRRAFIDRMFNPRPALHACASMSALLAAAGATQGDHSGTVEFELGEVVNDMPAGGLHRVEFRLGARRGCLLCGDAAAAGRAFTAASQDDCVDLCTGALIAVSSLLAAGEPRTGLWAAVDA